MGDLKYSEWLRYRDFDEEWIHDEVSDPKWNAIFEEIEMALGIRLFIWQKHYIMTGEFRCYGATTAQVLRDLIVDVDAEPLDYSGFFGHSDTAIYKEELYQVKQKLDSAGIPTRRVRFSRLDKNRWEKKDEEQTSSDTGYVDYVYDIVKDNVDKFDAIYMDYIINLVGMTGLNTLIENRLVESCGSVDGRKLYALLDKSRE